MLQRSSLADVDVVSSAVTVDVREAQGLEVGMRHSRSDFAALNELPPVDPAVVRTKIPPDFDRSVVFIDHEVVIELAKV